MDSLNRKKRASVGFDQSHVVDDDDDAKVKMKYHTLLNEYLDLQKEFVSRKRKLQAAKQKGETILGEVRFLRHRRKCLLRNNARNTDKVPDSPNSDLNHTTSDTAPVHVDQVQVSDSLMKNEEAEGNDQANKGDARLTKNLKNHLICNKGSGKRKICWPDQVSLKV